MAREKVSTVVKGIAGYDHMTVQATRRATASRNGVKKARNQVLECTFGRTHNGRFFARAEGHEYKFRMSGPKRDIVNMVFEAALKRVGWRLPHAARAN